MPGNAIDSIVDRYRELLDIQEEIGIGVTTGTPKLTPAEGGQRLAAGVSLLSFDDFFPGWEQIEPAFRRVVKWAAEGDPDLLQKHDLLNLNMGTELFREIALAWYSGKNTASPEYPQASTEFLAIAGACLKPYLQAHSRQLMPMVEQSQWRRGRCPICGGSPDFSYLAKEEGARWLMCSRCDGVWPFQRLACPYCGTQDQTKLTYLTDDTEQYRLYFCDACRTYIKAIDMRKMLHVVRLPLERVLTLELDRQAAAEGYLQGG